ncbi:MAG: type I secretion C-terminal target domain-containing protein [Alphaproteobacteria bacterium]
MAGSPDTTSSGATRRIVLLAGEVQEILLAAGEAVVIDVDPALVTTTAENGNVVLLGPDGSKIVLIAAADDAETINVSIGGSIASLMEMLALAMANIASAAGSPPPGGTGDGTIPTGGSFFFIPEGDELLGNDGNDGNEGGGGNGDGGGAGGGGGGGSTGGGGTGGGDTTSFRTSGTSSTTNAAPTGASLSSSIVAENVAGGTVGVLAAVDPDAGDTHSFSVDDARFEVVGNVLKLKDDVALDHEAASSVVVNVTVSDAGGLSVARAFTIGVTNVNETPSDIVLSGSSVAENLEGGTVGTLSVVDPDAGDTHSWSVDDARFEVSGGVLKLKAGTSLDREGEASVDIKVTVADATGASRAETMSITVSNVNEAPKSISLSSSSVLENVAGAVVGTFGAADPDAGDTHSFSVLNDARFEVAGGELRLKAGVSLDYEAAQSLSLKVRATDAAGLTVDQNVTVTVVDAIERYDGTAGNDTMVGGMGADSLVAGGGADRVLGGGGDDIIVYNADVPQWTSGFGALNVGSPTIAGTNEFVSIQSKARSYDAFDGGDGRDTMVMTSGGDAFFLDDSYSSHPGVSTEARVLGVELFEAGSGDDVIDLTSKRAAYTTSATMNGGDGNDVLWSGDAADRLDGGEGNDNLWGGGGSDSLLGGAGADKLDGSIGDDVLEGGAGADSLIGGAGADRFVYRIDAVGAGDVIADFGAGDVLDVSQLLASLGGTTATASRYFVLVQNNANVELRMDAAGAGADASDALLVTIQNQVVSQVQTNFG